MYHTMFREPEMHGLFEFHPKGRFYARLEGLVHRRFRNEIGWNPFLIRHESPASQTMASFMGLQIMTEAQHNRRAVNWCIIESFLPDLREESDCWRLLKGILGSQLPSGVGQMEQLDLRPLLGSYCQVTVTHRKGPGQIRMQLENFTPVFTTPAVELLFPEFELSIFPDTSILPNSSAMDEARELVAMEQSEILTV